MKMKRVADGARITTLEGIGTPGHLHPLQKAWILHGGAQCGFCTPGFIVSAKALLDHNPKPTREQVRDWFQDHRNACRCTGYKPLVDAVMDAAAVMRGEKDAAELEYKEPANGAVWGTRRPRPSTVARCDRDRALRRGYGRQAASGYPAPGPGSGYGFPCQHQGHRHF